MSKIKNSHISVQQTPLFVDLDGTLIKTDLLIESFIALIKRNFLYIFLVLFWLVQGKARLKTEIAKRVSIDAKLLPYHINFLKYLKEEFLSERQIILATASHKKFANQIAGHLGIFNDVIASDENINLSGNKKLQSILTISGERNFDYAGNSLEDLQIWRHAQQAILVSPGGKVERLFRHEEFANRIFDQQKSGIRPYIDAMRLHQWLKNLLIFVPLFLSHDWYNTSSIINAVLAFIAFSLCASGNYILNDLLDLNADRSHSRKCTRPIPAGDVSLLKVSLLMGLLLCTGLIVGLLLSLNFLLLLILYLVLTVSYSLNLKKRMLMDVIVLAGLYTIRVIAGGEAVAVDLSFWLLAFSMFIFLSLALVKRCSELTALMQTKRLSPKGRGYRVSDLGILSFMGVASGYLSVQVLALFINSTDVMEQYNRHEVLWLLCPVMLYWISRVWLKVGRNQMHDDPIVFAVKDRGSWFVGFISLIIVIFAI